MVLTVSFALSPVIGLFCHRRQRGVSGPLGLTSPLRQLDASVEASGPHDFAVRKPAPSSEAPPASTASHPASVTIAIRPSCGTRRADFAFDLGSRSTTPIATDWHDGQTIRAFVPFPPRARPSAAARHEGVIINSEWSADVRLGAQNGLKSVIAPCPKSSNNGLMRRSKTHRYSITSSARASHGYSCQGSEL